MRVRQEDVKAVKWYSVRIMRSPLAVIDSVYGWIIRISMSGIDRCIQLYTEDDIEKKAEEQEENNVDEVEIAFFEVDEAKQEASFKTVREVMRSYEKKQIITNEDVSHLSVPLDVPVAVPMKSETVKEEKDIFDVGAQKNTVMYAQGIRVPVYANPTIEFDAQIGEIPFGEMIIVLEPRGRFYRIAWNTLEGWVLRDDVADRAIRVYPQFVVGEENSIDHPNTAHVRAILSDVFGLSKSEFPLQSGEYVLYRLWRKGIHVIWPATRPRVPGSWHRILKGSPQVHIGVIPKVGAVMEYLLSPDVGHLAFVDAIFPDGTITISEAHFPDAGIYNERVLMREEWKDLHPLFLTFSSER